MKPLLCFFFAVFLAQTASAQLIDKRVTELAPLDQQYMSRQRELITEMTLKYYGGRCCRRPEELDYLERLLRDRHVRGDQTAELQAMGVLLGDLLASESDLHWVVYEDINGRSRALRLDDSDNYLFPVTMISRRREAGDNTPVMDIYTEARDTVEALRPPRPFE